MAGSVLKLAPPETRYDTALEILEALMALAIRARTEGWEVNVAIETGGPERITFAASRMPPASEGV